MKDKIVYIIVFAFVFIIVTASIIYLNSIFNNIFAFDFRPANTVVAPADSLKNAALLAQKKDSTSALNLPSDSLKQQQPVTKNIDTTSITLKDTVALKTLSKKIKEKRVAQQNEQPKTNIPADNQPVGKIDPNKDSTYREWIKNTAKLYTSMDSKKAAKIIQGYSDNIARDILFTMKKKKAAEILGEFKPELATRIISVQQ